MPNSMKGLMRMRPFSKRSKRVLTRSKYVSFFSSSSISYVETPLSGNFCSSFTNLCLTSKRLLLRSVRPPLTRHNTLCGQHISSIIYVDASAAREGRLKILFNSNLSQSSLNLVNRFGIPDHILLAALLQPYSIILPSKCTI